MKLKKVLHLSTHAAFGVELATERGTYQFMEVSPSWIEWVREQGLLRYKEILGDISALNINIRVWEIWNIKDFFVFQS